MKAMLQKLRFVSPGRAMVALEACFWLGLLRLLLAVVPFRWVFAWAERTSCGEASSLDDPEERILRIRQALRRAVRRCPWKSSCLVQALAARAMLSLRGIRSELRIGVKGPEFEAHAWLYSGSLPVVGTEASADFSVLT